MDEDDLIVIHEDDTRVVFGTFSSLLVMDELD